MTPLRLVSLMTLACASAAHAQAVPPVTSIVPDTAVDRALGTTVSTSGTVTTIDGGQLAGTNLFHSFATFDLGQGDTARWVHSTSNPAAITNVISRVTGGAPSSIFGTLDSTALPNADFFFINPAGIVLGNGAQVDVPAAAYFSTASELRFANGDVFTVATPSGSTMSVASPQAFGFLGSEGDIEFTEGTILSTDARLDLTAANIRLSAAKLHVTGGLTLNALGQRPSIMQLDGSSILNIAAGLGVVELTKSTISSLSNSFGPYNGIQGADITINAGTVRVEDHSDVSNIVSVDGPYVDVGGSIIINSGQLFLQNSAFYTRTISPDDIAGSILINSSTAELSGSHLTVGQFGRISIGASGNVRLVDSSLIAESNNVIFSGSIDVKSQSLLDISNTILSTTNFGAGSSGSIDLSAKILNVGGGSLISTRQLSPSGNGGIGGIIRMAADEIHVSDSTITSENHGVGGGEITLTADDVLSVTDTLITSEYFGTQDGFFKADVTLTAGREVSIEGTTISTSTHSPLFVPAGLITIEAGGLRQRLDQAPVQGTTLAIHGSRIVSDTIGGGMAGSILLWAGDILVDGGSVISSQAFDTPGSAGASSIIAITALTLTIDGSSVSSASYSPNGSEGFLALWADRVWIVNSASISSSNFSTGNAGKLSITGTTEIVVRDGAMITTNASEGPAGNIIISLPADGILLLDGQTAPVTISTSSGPGTGGIIIISNPLAIISNGASILALGQSGGANVQIDTPFFISSTDRQNSVAVDGTLLITGAITDVSSGTVEPDLSVVDASSVLRGQCTAVRSSGTVSQLDIRPVGPFGSETPAIAARGDHQPGAPGGCP